MTLLNNFTFARARLAAAAHRSETEVQKQGRMHQSSKELNQHNCCSSTSVH
jgi:hypothetical protein